MNCSRFTNNGTPNSSLRFSIPLSTNDSNKVSISIALVFIVSITSFDWLISGFQTILKCCLNRCIRIHKQSQPRYAFVARSILNDLRENRGKEWIFPFRVRQVSAVEGSHNGQEENGGLECFWLVSMEPNWFDLVSCVAVTTCLTGWWARNRINARAYRLPPFVMYTELSKYTLLATPCIFSLKSWAENEEHYDPG